MKEIVSDIMLMSWSKETCYKELQSKWSIDNPSLGQSIVTFLIVNDIFDGKIMKCEINGISHYYNLIDEKNNRLNSQSI